jgi:hypothetical protein
MKKLFLTGVVTLLLTTSAVQAAEPTYETCRDTTTTEAAHDRCMRGLSKSEQCREYLQDGEAAETPEQKAGYDHCMQEANKPKPAAFKPGLRIWQCNDIRVTERINQPGIVNYDLGGTIWGGSQFTLDLNRSVLYFNGKPCQKLFANW